MHFLQFMYSNAPIYASIDMVPNSFWDTTGPGANEHPGHWHIYVPR